MAYNIKKLLKSRKFRFGSVSLAFAAAFIAIILLINAIISVFDAKHGLYIDTTGENRYDISEKTIESLSGIEENIEIYFFMERDDILQTSPFAAMVLTLAEKYSTTFPNISVKHLDLKRDFKQVSELSELAGATPNKYSAGSDVIIKAADSGRARLIRLNAFFGVDEVNYPISFNGEARFTNSILMTVNSSDYKVVFINGHHENTNPTGLIDVLGNSGYSNEQIITVDLSKEDIPENTRLVIINNPQYDYVGGYGAATQGGVNEIAKLENYLNSPDGGNIFVCLGSETKALPELKGFLANKCGIDYMPGQKVLDNDNSSTENKFRILPEYSNAQGGILDVSALTSGLSENKVVMESCVPLKIADKTNGRQVIPLLVSSKNSAIIDGDGNSVPQKNVPLMLISTKDLQTDYFKDAIYSHVIVSGSTDFFLDIRPEENDNGALVQKVLRMVGTKTVTVEGIEPKPFNDTKLATLPTKKAKSMTLTMAFVPALIISIAGIAVYIRRKRL